MAQRIKEVSSFDGTNWGTAYPIGADAANIDVPTTGNTTRPLTSVLGSVPATGDIITGLNNKVNTSGGDTAATVVSSIADNTTESSDLTTGVVATSGETQTSLWTKFNLFRRRVSNNFNNYFATANLVGADPGVSATGTDDTVYTTAALNNYFSNVIGYESASAPDAGSVASQLSTLNSNAIKKITRSGTTFTATKIDGTTTTFTQQDYNLIYDTFSKNNVSIAGDNVATVTITGITFRSGYVRIFLGGHCTNSDTSGVNVSNCYIYGTLSVPAGTTSGTIHVRNLASTAAKVDVYVRILYISSSLTD